MSQLNILRTEKKKIKLNVEGRIAYAECPLDSTIKVYDKNGCEIKEADSSNCKQCDNTSTGESTSETSGLNTELSSTMSENINDNNFTANYVQAETINTKYPPRYNVRHYMYGEQNKERNYVKIDDCKLELNFDTDYIIVETNVVKTTCSKRFNCDLPVIPNNGLLIEALVYYCMYKMLCRGYVHPVFNLAASQYGTNPYYMWIQLKDEAKRSIINGKIDDASKLFRSNFLINTFDSRR